MVRLYDGFSDVRCCGLCVTTNDSFMSHWVMFFVAAPYVMFILFVAYPLHYAHVIVAVGLYVLMYLMLIIGANTDPGIVPPNYDAPTPLHRQNEEEMVTNLNAHTQNESSEVTTIEANQIQPEILVDGALPVPSPVSPPSPPSLPLPVPPPPIVRDVVLMTGDEVVLVGPNNDNEYICRYCHTCRIVRPPRASHCAGCNYCVREYDHHCGFLGICVGERTWRYFTWFSIIANAACLYIFVVCIYSVATTSYESSDYGRWLEVCAIGLIVFTALMGCSMLGHTCMYVSMSLRNLTGRDAEGHGAAYWDSSKPFPFDFGFVRNMWRKLCCPERTSEIVVTDNIHGM